MSNIKEYRIEKDDLNQYNRFKEHYPEYCDFITSFQNRFYDYDYSEMTMGADYGFYHGLVNSLVCDKPKHVVEYGPGFTTLLIDKVLSDLGYDYKFTSYENESKWYKILDDIGCNPNQCIELVDSRIVKDADDAYYFEYIHDLDKHRDVDYVIIDGPGEVYVNDIRKDNINVNLDMMEKRFNRSIRHIIDGRKKTRKFYELPFDVRSY